LDEFFVQDFRQLGVLYVSDIIPNWPYELNVLTNYGIFVLTFEDDLYKNSSIGWNYSSRIIRLHSNVQGKITYSSTYAVNSWGFAFLIKIYNSTTSDF
jgi:hypothetical protein